MAAGAAPAIRDVHQAGWDGRTPSRPWQAGEFAIDYGLFNPERTFMSDALKTIIADSQDQFNADPASAQATFSSSSTLQDGLRSHVQIRGHRLTIDEPESLGGSDAGPNPVELLLAALGTCQEITYRAYATALGISLQNVSVDLEGDIDLRGFFGVDDTVQSGYQKIRGTVSIVSDASEAQLEKLRIAVNAHCPVLDTLTRPVAVDLTLDTRKTLA